MSVKNFSLWASCPKSKVHPIINITYDIVTIPEAPNDSNCIKNYLGAVSPAHILHEFIFNGTWKGGNNSAPGEEMAIFTETDIVNWNGKEIGFIYRLNEGKIRAYVQNIYPFFWWKDVVIDDAPDGKEHVYRATVRPSGNITDFYIDEKLKATISAPSSLNYYNLSYNIVGTTHRDIGGWNSYNYKIIMKNTRYR